MTFERIPRTHVRIAGRSRSAFLACGWTGYGIAAVIALGLSAARGLSVAAELAIALSAIAVYSGVAEQARRFTGRAVLVYYHHILVFLVSAGAVAALLGQPVLALLDVTAVALAAFSAVARIGCLMVGCCHGRPATWGVAYGSEHVGVGVPAYLVGVRLLPVQAFEAAVFAVLAALGCVEVLAGAPHGTALMLFLTGYAGARFALEWLRGDLERHELHRLSEPQWTSLGVAAAVTLGAVAGLLPGGGWPSLALGGLLVAAAVTMAGRAPGRQALLAPAHVHELSGQLERLAPSPLSAVATSRTSRGLCVSAGVTAPLVHYTLSTDRGPLTEEEAEHLSRLLLWLRHPQAQAQLVRGAAGAVHVVLGPP